MELTTELLDYLKEVTPGNTAIYRLRGDAVETLYRSPGLPSLNGMTEAEYDAKTRENAADVVLPADRKDLLEAVHRAVETETPVNTYYRAFHQTRGFDWVHANARYCGMLDGFPVILAVYANASVETDIYQNILDHADSMVFVCDCASHELLYANAAAFRRWKGSANSLGEKCYVAMQGRDTPCQDCVMSRKNREGPLSEKRYDPARGVWEHITGEFVDWCGHDAFVHYIDDITAEESKRSEMQNQLSAEKHLVRVTRLLSRREPVENRLSAALELIGTFYAADRAYFFQLDPGGKTVSNTYEWCSAGVLPQKDSLQKVDKRIIARWVTCFRRNQAVVVPDIEAIRTDEPEEYAILSRQNIRSYLEAPLMTGGEITGFLGVDNPDSDKILNAHELLMALAYAVSASLERAENERRLLDSRRRYALAVEGAELGVWEYHIKEHRLTNPNSRFLRYGIPETVEDFPNAVIPRVLAEDREKLREMYRRVDAGEPVVSADIWMRWTPSDAPVCERVVYSVVKDESGAPDVAYGISIDVTAQKQEQAKFHQAMQALLTANPEALGTLLVNLTRNSCDEGHSASPFMEATMKAKTLDELVGVVSGLIPSDSERQEFLERFSCEKLLEAFRAGKNYLQFEYRRLGEKGKPFWMRTYINMLKNPATGDVEGVIYSVDITRERQQNDILRILTGKEYDLIAVLHLDTLNVDAIHLGETLPAPYLQIYADVGASCPFDVMRSHGADTWVAPEDRKKYLEGTAPERVRSELDKNGFYELTIQGNLPGCGIMFRKLQHYYLGEDRDTVLIIDSDVTKTYLQQRRELERTKAEAQRIRDILDYISSGVCVLVMPDENHLNIDYSNKQMPRLLGFENGEQQTADFSDGTDGKVESYFSDAFSGVHPDDLSRVRRAYREGYHKEHFTVPDFRLMTGSGRYIWVSVEVVLREIRPAGKVFYGTYRNVTEEIRLRRELTKKLETEETLRKQATAASAAKTDFVSRISHDIRTPINAITGMTAFAREDMQDPAKLGDDLNKIEDSTRHLLSLINDVLDISKAESGKIELHPEPYPFDEYIRSIRDLFAPLCEQNGLKFVVTGNASGKGVVVDRVRFDQVAFNLLSNAVKYTPAGGTVTYESESRNLPGGFIDCGFTVRDTGVGMSEAFQKTMFEPFTQEHDNPARTRMASGTGLGLSIVKRIVDLMGGSITVRSAVGKGSAVSVRFRLPAATEEQLHACADRQQPVQNELRPKLSGRVLLAEDNPLNTEIALRLLRSFGLRADAAEDGEKAVQAFSASGPGEYGLVLMDLQMPVMDGYTAAKTIRALKRADAETVPILAMTADVFGEAIDRCRASGMDGHLAKPVDPDALYGAVRAALEK